jgi:hypothetical protein
MSTTLFKQLSTVSDRYLQDSELSSVQSFASSYSNRINAYLYLQEHRDSLILKALRKMMPSHRQTVQKHSDVCKRDMDYVLRYIALSILKDDEAGFVEELVLWMQNILFALHKEDQSTQFYMALQDVILEEMPQQDAAIVNHYLSIFIESLKVGTR